MSMCESILTIALVCTVKYLHYCDYYYTLGNDSQSTPKLIAYVFSLICTLYLRFLDFLLSWCYHGANCVSQHYTLLPLARPTANYCEFTAKSFS